MGTTGTTITESISLSVDSGCVEGWEGMKNGYHGYHEYLMYFPREPVLCD